MRKLNPQQVENVKEWLRLYNNSKKKRCPFIDDPEGCLICSVYFDRVKTELTEYMGSMYWLTHTGCRCPCGSYPLDHVIFTALEMLENSGEDGYVYVEDE